MDFWSKLLKNIDLFNMKNFKYNIEFVYSEIHMFILSSKFTIIFKKKYISTI